MSEQRIYFFIMNVLSSEKTIDRQNVSIVKIMSASENAEMCDSLF